jgi:class 3 adenylate cyclase/pimeloyl-ACP methyl ester carboxylesterase
MEIHDTRYVKTPDGVHIAYQVTGDGPIDLVWQFDHTGDVDLVWLQAGFGAFLRDLAGLGRLILHDRRGTGLSSRNVPPPDLETRSADLLRVLDTVGSDRPVLFGYSEGGAANAWFAASHPDRVRSMVWFEPIPRISWAPDFPWGVGAEYVEADQRSLDLWGTNEYGDAVVDAELAAGDDVQGRSEDAHTLGLLSRHTATPDVARELSRIWYETDVRAVLPSVQTPTLLFQLAGLPNWVAATEHVASLMPNTTLQLFEGHYGTESNAAILDLLRPFLGVDAPVPELDTVLATVLFTDIVDSTRKQAELGDRGWKELVLRHHDVVREALRRYRGTENDTAGDGFFATFDGPARAVRCAQEIVAHVRDLGVEVRAGVHTGECEIVDGKHSGIAVSIGARVAGAAAASEVLVSQTVKDLTAGSGLTYADAGEHELKGVPDRWRLYRVVD